MSATNKDNDFIEEEIEDDEDIEMRVVERNDNKEEEEQKQHDKIIDQFKIVYKQNNQFQCIVT